MESLGIEGTDEETSLLQESISLKAFLKCNKESRRDHLISTIEPSSLPIQTPEKFLGSSSLTSVAATASAISSSFHQENRLSSSTSISSAIHASQTKANMSNSHGKFSLSYDPADSVMRSPKAPRSPVQSHDYFNDMSNDESKLPMNQRYQLHTRSLHTSLHPSHYQWLSLYNYYWPMYCCFDSSLSASTDADYLTDRDRSKVAENFNAMNTIINSTFKEKIDYQRKLREQQVCLRGLK